MAYGYRSVFDLGVFRKRFCAVNFLVVCLIFYKNVENLDGNPYRVFCLELIYQTNMFNVNHLLVFITITSKYSCLE